MGVVEWNRVHDKLVPFQALWSGNTRIMLKLLQHKPVGSKRIWIKKKLSQTKTPQCDVLFCFKTTFHCWITNPYFLWNKYPIFK